MFPHPSIFLLRSTIPLHSTAHSRLAHHDRYNALCCRCCCWSTSRSMFHIPIPFHIPIAFCVPIPISPPPPAIAEQFTMVGAMFFRLLQHCDLCPPTSDYVRMRKPASTTLPTSSKTRQPPPLQPPHIPWKAQCVPHSSHLLHPPIPLIRYSTLTTVGTTIPAAAAAGCFAPRSMLPLPFTW